MQAQELRPGDYARRGDSESFHLVKSVKRLPDGAVHVLFQAGPKIKVQATTLLEVARPDPPDPSGTYAELHVVMQSISTAASAAEIRQKLLDRALTLGLSDPESTVDAFLLREAQPEWLKRLGAIGALIGVARFIRSQNHDTNPDWIKPPKRANRQGLAGSSGGAGHALDVVTSPDGHELFQRVMREIPVDHGDGPPIWRLRPWLQWDAASESIRVVVGHTQIGVLGADDTAFLGPLIRKSKAIPLVELRLSEPEEIRAWLYV